MGTLVIRPRARWRRGSVTTPRFFHLFIYLFLSDWKQVCFHEMCFLYQQFAARRESHSSAQQLHTKMTPGQFPQCQTVGVVGGVGRGFLSAAAAAADLPPELQLLGWCGPPVRSGGVCRRDVTYGSVLGDKKQEAVSTQLRSATLIRAFVFSTPPPRES